MCTFLRYSRLVTSGYVWSRPTAVRHKVRGPRRLHPLDRTGDRL